MAEKVERLEKLVGLVELIQLVKLVDSIEEYEKEQTTNGTYRNNYTNYTNFTNHTIVMFVQKRHMQRAWRIIKPCLEYANELITYVDMGKGLAKTRECIKKFGGERVSHSDLMRMTNLSAKELKESIVTLYEREEIKINNEKKTRANGRVYISKHYSWKSI